MANLSTSVENIYNMKAFSFDPGMLKGLVARQLLHSPHQPETLAPLSLWRRSFRTCVDNYALETTIMPRKLKLIISILS